MTSHSLFREKMSAAEKAIIAESLDQNERHPILAAVALGIHPVTLWRKMKAYGIEV